MSAVLNGETGGGDHGSDLEAEGSGHVRSGPAVVVSPVQQRQSLEVRGHGGLALRRVAEEDAQRLHLAGAHGGVEAGAAVLQGGAERRDTLDPPTEMFANKRSQVNHH